MDDGPHQGSLGGIGLEMDCNISLKTDPMKLEIA